MNNSKLWNATLDIIKTKVSKISYDTWFADSKLYKLIDNKAIVLVQMHIQKKNLKENYNDLIEEVFGDIEDEYDDENKEIEVIKEDEYIVDGSAKLDVVSELIGVNMESEEFDSVGGLIIGELGRFPEQDEEIVLNNIKFKVEEIDKNRVKKVRIFT